MKKYLILYALVATNAAWADWVQVYDNNDATFYVDPATIRKDPGVRQATDLKDFKKADPDGTKSRLAQREYECKAGRSRIVSMSTFTGHKAGGTMISNSNDASDWFDISTDSAYYAVLQKVCAK